MNLKNKKYLLVVPYLEGFLSKNIVIITSSLLLEVQIQRKNGLKK